MKLEPNEISILMDSLDALNNYIVDEFHRFQRKSHIPRTLAKLLPDEIKEIPGLLPSIEADEEKHHKQVKKAEGRLEAQRERITLLKAKLITLKDKLLVDDITR